MDWPCSTELNRRLRATARGFTLIESCIALAVVAIVTCSVAPGLSDLFESRRLNGVAAQLATDIQFARSSAVARNRSLRISFSSTASSSCYVVHTGSAADCVCASSAPAVCSGAAIELRTVVLPASDRVVLQSNVASILFDPMHGTSTPTGTLRLIDSHGRAIHHVINIMGRVRTCSPLGAVPGHRVC